MEIRAFVLAKNGVVIDVFPELELAMEEGARQYYLDAMEGEDEDGTSILPPRWERESDDTWNLWGEYYDYTVTCR